MFDLTSFPQTTGAILGLMLISIWTLVWKGFGLWYAAEKKQKWWFIAILILNTLGLLPIIYLIWFKDRNIKKRNIKKKK